MKNKIKILLAFILGICVTSGVVYAANLLASGVSYNNANSGLQATDVQGALDELNNKTTNYYGIDLVYWTDSYSNTEYTPGQLPTNFEEDYQTVTSGVNDNVFVRSVFMSDKIIYNSACGKYNGNIFCISPDYWRINGNDKDPVETALNSDIQKTLGAAPTCEKRIDMVICEVGDITYRVDEEGFGIVANSAHSCSIEHNDTTKCYNN